MRRMAAETDYDHARNLVRCAVEETRPRPAVRRKSFAALQRFLRAERMLGLSATRLRLESGAELVAVIEHAKRGDQQAAAVIYRHYEPRIRSRMRRATRDVHAAEDLTAIALARAFRSLHGWRSPADNTAQAFSAWMMKIADHVLSDH